MKTVIYKGAKKPDVYLYVEQKDSFERVPQALLDQLGTLVWVMELELSAQTSLANADFNRVMAELKDNGYYLQLPPKIV